MSVDQASRARKKDIIKSTGRGRGRTNWRTEGETCFKGRGPMHQTAWTWYDTTMTRPWQDPGTTMTRPWHDHDTTIAVPWSITIARPWDDYGMIIEWSLEDLDMTIAWPWHDHGTTNEGPCHAHSRTMACHDHWRTLTWPWQAMTIGGPWHDHGLTMARLEHNRISPRRPETSQAHINTVFFSNLFVQLMSKLAIYLGLV